MYLFHILWQIDKVYSLPLSHSHSILLSLHSRCCKIRLNDGIRYGFSPVRWCLELSYLSYRRQSTYSCSLCVRVHTKNWKMVDRTTTMRTFERWERHERSMIARRCRCLIGHSNPMVARASMHASMVISSFFFYYVYVSRDDRMAVTKEEIEGEIGLFLSFGMTE